ncbi:F-box/kelch-repeat protein At3g23880-like [Corylus avellana]|uniref:F-box/kelch-repeat protein At3g23880-like n=1 Tax=Corylus avellana TaxID=13451 RepID=UPI001E23E67E|nr:F-box/kelch-repeat protein At3g23880-like [Corylus avellana]
MLRNSSRAVSGEGEEEKKGGNMSSRDFAEDLLMEILSRLPVKSLMRFKCVSKSFYALITKPCFITKHLTSHNPHREAILRRGKGSERPRFPMPAIPNENQELALPRLSRLSDETLELSEDVDLSQLFQDEVSGVQLLGPCNGILCLVGTLKMTKDGDLQPGYEMVLWNPATRESKMLPPMDMPTSTFTSYFGFGFDPKTNDYNVIWILNFDFRQCKVEVYSLSTNSWRVIDSSPNPSLFIKLPRFPSCLNGVHYWWACESEDYFDEGPRHFIAFDMSNEVFQELLPPPTRGFYLEGIAVFNDSVTLILPSGNLMENWIEIWVLNESGVESTWTPGFAIRHIPHYWCLIQLREDDSAVLTDEDDCLVLYHNGTQERRNLQIVEARPSQLVTYTESLILLNGSGNVLEQQATS